MLRGCTLLLYYALPTENRISASKKTVVFASKLEWSRLSLWFRVNDFEVNQNARINDIKMIVGDRNFFATAKVLSKY